MSIWVPEHGENEGYSKACELKYMIYEYWHSYADRQIQFALNLNRIHFHNWHWLLGTPV